MDVQNPPSFHPEVPSRLTLPPMDADSDYKTPKYPSPQVTLHMYLVLISIFNGQFQMK